MATEPLMRWLIGAAEHRTTVTYRDAGDRLERECGFSRIFSLHMGIPAGAMQYALLSEDPGAPLLHALLVRKGSGVPGPGARVFLEGRFPDVPELQHDGVDQAHPEVWAEFAAIAAEEVYGYPGWAQLYEQMYGEYVPDPFFAPPVEDGGTSRGGAGEGPNHRALRLWMEVNPARIGRRYGNAETTTEEQLLSGDRVDVVYYTDKEVLAIEVKSRDSEWSDLERGIYQCVKYRAVLCAQEREGRTVRALLVTESELPRELAGRAKRLDITLRSFPPDGR